MSGYGPGLTTWGARQVVGYLGYTGHKLNGERRQSNPKRPPRIQIRSTRSGFSFPFLFAQPSEHKLALRLASRGDATTKIQVITNLLLAGSLQFTTELLFLLRFGHAAALAL